MRFSIKLKIYTITICLLFVTTFLFAETPLSEKEKSEPVIIAELEPALPSGSLVYVPPKKITKSSSEPYRNHLKADFSFEYLDPNDTYGSWKNFGIAYYRKQSDSLSYSLHGGVFWRDEGNGTKFGAGISKTWNKYFYTSSSVSAGTNVSYLSELSLSQSFNFKVGQKRNNIVPIGFTYTKSRSGHESYRISSGIVAYRSGWVYQYKISRNQNEPGSIVSYSHLASVAHGKEGLQWLHFTLSSGKEAYLATYLSIPEEVDKNSYGAAIRFKRWLGKNYGILGDISYFTLDSSYNKYGLSFGMFTDF